MQIHISVNAVCDLYFCFLKQHIFAFIRRSNVLPYKVLYNSVPPLQSLANLFSKKTNSKLGLPVMEINFLVRVSARMDFFCHVKIFHRSSQIVFFSNNEAPESDKIGI